METRIFKNRVAAWTCSFFTSPIQNRHSQLSPESKKVLDCLLNDRQTLGQMQTRIELLLKQNPAATFSTRTRENATAELINRFVSLTKGYDINASIPCRAPTLARGVALGIDQAYSEVPSALFPQSARPTPARELTPGELIPARRPRYSPNYDSIYHLTKSEDDPAQLPNFRRVPELPLTINHQRLNDSKLSKLCDTWVSVASAT